MKPKVRYPFLPDEGQIRYTDMGNRFIAEAKEIAARDSLDVNMPNASVIVKDDKIIASGANGSDYHEKHGCERIRQKIPTGQGYELCEGCHPRNHSERKAVADGLSKGLELKNTEIYLWGHWWCCESCWDVMLANGTNTVYLLKDSEILFNREHPDNVIGHQFEV